MLYFAFVLDSVHVIALALDCLLYSCIFLVLSLLVASLAFSLALLLCILISFSTVHLCYD